MNIYELIESVKRRLLNVELRLEGIVGLEIKIMNAKMEVDDLNINIYNSKNELEKISFNKHQIMKIEKLNDFKYLIIFDGMQKVILELV